MRLRTGHTHEGFGRGLRGETLVSSRASSRAASPARDSHDEAPVSRTETRSEEVTLTGPAATFADNVAASSGPPAGQAGRPRRGASPTPSLPDFGDSDDDGGYRRDDASPGGPGQNPDGHSDSASVADAEGPVEEPNVSEVLLLELLENRPTGFQSLAEYYLGSAEITEGLGMMRRRRHACAADHKMADFCLDAVMKGRVPDGPSSPDFREERHRAFGRLLGKAEKVRAFLEDRTRA